jgi:hypothetical protein
MTRFEGIAVAVIIAGEIAMFSYVGYVMKKQNETQPYFYGHIDSVTVKPYAADKIEILNDYAIDTLKPCTGTSRRRVKLDVSITEGNMEWPINHPKFDKEWTGICFALNEDGTGRLPFHHESEAYTYWVHTPNLEFWLFYDETVVA